MTLESITSIVVDDEANNRENIQMLLREFCPMVTIVGEAENLEEARKAIDEEQPQLVFLDIQVGNETVFSLLSQLEEIDFAIIFVTAHEKHALRAFEFMAVDYLMKPIQIPALVKAVNNAILRIKPNKAVTPMDDILKQLEIFNRTRHKVALATSRGAEMVYIKDIMYCQADGSYTRFTFLTGPPLVVSRNLKYYENILSEYDFVRCHNTTLVNLQYVKVLERAGGGAIIMEDGTELPISKTKRMELDARIKLNRRLI